MLPLVLLQQWTTRTWHPASFAATPAPLVAAAAAASHRHYCQQQPQQQHWRDCFHAALTALQQQQVPSALLRLLLL
jgi:7-keto-8-aminopelargonate synthetase-like enzyme